jgi:hypothetical protein
MEKSGFFNSNSGDRVYDATDFAAYFGDLVSNGIFYRAADNLQVIAAMNMIVTVQPGSAWINGYHYQNTTPMDLTITTADGVNPRIDRIAVQWSNVNRAINIVVKTGAAAATPQAPALTRNDQTWELGIADILIPKSSAAVTSDNITDTRLNSALCGFVNSLVSAVYE